MAVLRARNRIVQFVGEAAFDSDAELFVRGGFVSVSIIAAIIDVLLVREAKQGDKNDDRAKLMSKWTSQA